MDILRKKERMLLGVISLLIGGLLLVQMFAGRDAESRSTETELLPEFESVFGQFVNQQQLADLLVQAVIDVESGGDPHAVGSQGERGLMQIMPGTWKETTGKMFGRPVSFDRAFDPVLNKRVGRTYLGYLQTSLVRSRERWKSDERSLLLAAYNAGPAAIRRSGFDVSNINPQTKRYIRKVAARHDQLLEEHDLPTEKILVKQKTSARTLHHSPDS